MARVIKWFALGLVAVVALVVLLVVAIILLVDPNDYRDDIGRIVEEQTGQELVIEGDIRLSFFPWLGLDLGRTRLENREGFGDDPFVSIESAGIAVKLMPLLRREVELDTVRLDGLRANLIVNEDGDANWDLDLPGDDEVAPDEPTVAVDDDDADAEPGQLPVTIGTIQGVRITNLHVNYEDWQTGARHQAGPVNLSLGELLLDEDVSLDADWVASLDDDTRVEGSLEGLLQASSDFQRFSASLTNLQALAFAEGLPEDGLELEMSAVFDADLEQDTARLSDFVARVAGLRLDAAADITALTADPRVEGTFGIPETDLRRVLERMEIELPEMADDDALRRFSLDGSFTALTDRADITELAIRLDDTRLNGTASITDFATQAVRFDFHGDRFDADRYLPPGTGDEGAGAATVGEAGDEDAEAAEIPLEPLRDLNLEGRFRLDELRVAGFDVTDIGINVSAADGLIRIHPLVARLYQGEYQGDIRLDATGDVLRVSANERLSGVQAQPIVTQFLGRDLLRGRGGFRLQAETAGLDPMAMLRELVGEMELDFADGAVVGLNLAQMTRNATARLQGQSAQEPEERTTDFTNLRALLRIDRGTIRNERLSVQSPLFRVDGGGEANIFEQTVDYALTVNLVGTLEGQDGASLDNLRRVPIPLRFSGSLLSPDINLDLQAALTAQQRERLLEGEEAVRERAREEEERARERARQEEERARERLQEEREQREGEVRDRARDQLRRLLD